MAIIPGILSMWINTLIQSTAFTLINTYLKYGPPNKTKQSAFGQASPESRLLLSSTLYTYSSCFKSYLHHANTMHGAPPGLAPGVSQRISLHPCSELSFNFPRTLCLLLLQAFCIAVSSFRELTLSPLCPESSLFSLTSSPKLN